jgi:hypothetical protein
MTKKIRVAYMIFRNIFRTIRSTIEIIEASEIPRMRPAVPPISDMNSNCVYSGDSFSIRIVSDLKKLLKSTEEEKYLVE